MRILTLSCFLTWCLSAISALMKVPFQDNRILEVMIPMRDGVQLHTVVVFPRGNSDKSNKFTAIVDRSPYGYGDLEWFADIFVPLGFVAIGQDMRGTSKSQGNFTMWSSDGNDSRDLGDWIVQQDWSNGEVMTFGASADGIGSLQTARTNPEWLTAQYIIWASSRLYDILYPFGAYKQETAEDWLLSLTMPNPDFVYTDIELVHVNEKHNAFWSLVELDENTYKNIRGKSGFWGGWYDLFSLGTIQAFEGYNTLSDPSVRYTSVITIDPLGHCLDGAEFFTENAVKGRTAVVIGQLFETFGIVPVQRSEVKNVTFYVMSSNDEAGIAAGQYWTSLETWPKPQMTNFYLHSDGSASVNLPTASEPPSTSFKYDPADPVPTLGGANLPDSIGGSIPCGPLDQSPADARSDVLTFQTQILTEELAITGGLYATLFVSSDAIDTDFTAKVSDVYPTGEVRLIEDNAIRMRWREGGLDPVYMEKDKVYKVEFNLWNTSYVFATGHSLRISISSSNYPRFSVNPNNGLLIADPRYPGDNVTAINTIYHSSDYPSHVTLPIVDKSQIPEVDVIKEVQKSYPMIDDRFIATNTAKLHQVMSKRRRVRHHQ